MELNVITPTNKIFDGKVVSVSLPGQAGTFQVLNNHTPIISSLKTGEIIVELAEKFEDFYLIPEGGTNELAVKGCEEILTVTDKKFDYICCAVGTGGTISGLINCSKKMV